jgi:dihydrofolate reductase
VVGWNACAAHVRLIGPSSDGDEKTMRKVIVSNLVSLDGFFEALNQNLDWFVLDEEFFEYSRSVLRSVGTLLFGRVTYQHMANYWLSAPAGEIADNMNNLPKIVFPTTLKTADWKNSRIVRDSIAEEVSKLKQQSGKGMVIFGSAALGSYLLQKGLVDEYRIILNPVLIGRGTRLFKGITESLKLKLSGTQSLSSGVVVLRYEPS